MRLVVSPPQAKGLHLPQKPSEWSLSLRFIVFIIPVGICMASLSLWVGYKTSSTALMQSIEAVPLLEAKTQADMMGNILSDMRNALSRIAQSDALDEREMRNSLTLRFHETLSLVQEITVRKEDGSGYMLLQDNGGFVSLSVAEASTSPNSPLQQIATIPLYPNRVTLYPPVFFAMVTSPRHTQEHRTPVMRMAMPLKDGSGTVILGINFAELRNRLTVIMRPGSPFRLPQQEGGMQLAFYFDVRGWILFEMDNAISGAYLPDTARQGYTGDLGRAGYEAAFRPWAMHENFWRMVTDVAAGRSGAIASAANKYTDTHVSASGVLCFAPVFFSSADGLAGQPIGGIAFFETSTLPLTTFLRLANYFLVIAVGALFLFGLVSWLLYRTVGRPLRQMTEELDALAQAPVPNFLKCPVGSKEQERLKLSVNRIISNLIRVHTDMEHLNREIHQSRSRQPVDLSLVVPTRDSSENDYGLLGSGALIREVREHVRKAAQAGTDVLIWGETGTGKELVAAAIHKASARAQGPYISINCGALDENLLLDTLFGHVKGAFTEAKADRKGAFLAADAGTLHLDEIANASLRVQQSLLRALSVRRIRVLGTDEETPFNTRIVAATNVDLRECVRAGTFREDLYYRLAIISIETPPLRHRKEDIPELAAFFIDDAARAQGRPPARLSHGALELMAAHDWPGNVREFKNCLARAMAFVEDDLILRQHIILERDAFRTYAKPISQKIRAEKMEPADRPAMPSTVEPGNGAKAGADTPDVKRGGIMDNLFYGGPFVSASSKDVFPLDKPSPAMPPRAVAAGNPKACAHRRRAGDKKPDKTKSSARGDVSPNTHGLNKRQLQALTFIYEHGELNRAEYEALAGVGFSSRTAQNDLRELMDRGILTRVGAGPGTRYRIRR